MGAADGHILMTNGGAKAAMVPSTRWKEMGQSLMFHANLTRAAGIRSEFRFLNGPIFQFTGEPNNDNMHLQGLQNALSGSPGGMTPLCFHITQIVQQVTAMQGQLRANNQKACVVIMTDGESSDGDLAAAMKPLERLPVWVVVRLCTGE